MACFCFCARISASATLSLKVIMSSMDTLSGTSLYLSLTYCKEDKEAGLTRKITALAFLYTSTTEASSNCSAWAPVVTNSPAGPSTGFEAAAFAAALAAASWAASIATVVAVAVAVAVVEVEGAASALILRGGPLLAPCMLLLPIATSLLAVRIRAGLFPYIGVVVPPFPILIPASAAVVEAATVLELLLRLGVPLLLKA
mmetsp:Transcript_12236/g.20456  ORF Transcript_12236/g.20456 Transcript_12236/m.20456 type:complete len:200 (-) Transcript_12236:381-980(-)